MSFLTKRKPARNAPVVVRKGFPKNVSKMKIPKVDQKSPKKQKSNIWNLKCTTCMKVNSSKCWSCTCGVRWLKCRMHVKRCAEEGDKSSKSPTRRIDERGIDQPFPKRRRGGEQIVLDRTQRAPGRGQIVLNPGTKLAMKFPHLVRKEAG